MIFSFFFSFSFSFLFFSFSFSFLFLFLFFFFLFFYITDIKKMRIFWQPDTLSTHHHTLPQPSDTNQDTLPITKYKLEFLFALDSSKVVIIIADTGSGKSTMLPVSFIYFSNSFLTPIIQVLFYVLNLLLLLPFLLLLVLLIFLIQDSVIK